MNHLKQFIFKSLLLLVSFITLSAVCNCQTCAAKVPSTQKRQLNEGWVFLRHDVGSIKEAVSPAKILQWEKVTLPHCFNASDAVEPTRNYYRGPGC
jgi:beta-galactosidase